MLVKLDHFPKNRDEHKKILELPPPCLSIFMVYPSMSGVLSTESGQHIKANVREEHGAFSRWRKCLLLFAIKGQFQGPPIVGPLFPNYTPPKFNSSPLKIDDWKTSFLLGMPIFRGYVKFMGCIFPYHFHSRIPWSTWKIWDAYGRVSHFSGSPGEIPSWQGKQRSGSWSDLHHYHHHHHYRHIMLLISSLSLLLASWKNNHRNLRVLDHHQIKILSVIIIITTIITWIYLKYLEQDNIFSPMVLWWQNYHGIRYLSRKIGCSP